jgi:hypothetical protein
MDIEEQKQVLSALLSHPICSLPVNYDCDYFPDFICQRTDEFLKYYRSAFIPFLIESGMHPIKAEGTFTSIAAFKDSIFLTLEKFLSGDVLSATNNFNTSLKTNLYHIAKHNARIEPGKDFFRARIQTDKIFTRSDLFHVPYQLRHLVFTNRYSIPGLPALYLGDSTYTCWEEYNKPALKSLAYSRFNNAKTLNVIKILRPADIVEEFADRWQNLGLGRTWHYLRLFPLYLACCVSVKHPNAPFKPEYIIPQMLLQYVSQGDEFDGIMYPSTKVDYMRLQNLKSYNYIFPVKTNSRTGYCPILKSAFRLTEPTSLELEELISHPSTKPHLHDGGGPDAAVSIGTIQLINGVNTAYSSTSFGLLEKRLKTRLVQHLD